MTSLVDLTNSLNNEVNERMDSSPAFMRPLAFGAVTLSAFLGSVTFTQLSSGQEPAPLIGALFGATFALSIVEQILNRFRQRATFRSFLTTVNHSLRTLGRPNAFAASLITYREEMSRRAQEHLQENAHFLKPLLVQHINSLTDEKKAEFLTDIENGEATVFCTLPRLALTHLFSTPAPYNEQNTPPFFHPYLDQLNEPRTQLQFNTISTALHRDPIFIAVMQEVLKS